MAHGTPQINQRKNRKEVNHLWRVKCITSLTKIKISKKLILEKIQKLISELHPFSIQLWRAGRNFGLYEELLLQLISKIR